MPQRSDPLLLLIGRQAAAAWRDIAEFHRGVESAILADVVTAADWLTHSTKMPALIVVSQEYPGAIATADIDRLPGLAR